MAAVSVPFSGTGNIHIYYLTFDNGYDANSYFMRISPSPPDYTYVGQFDHATIGDSTKCQRNAGQGQTISWGCLTLSADVVTYSSVIENGSSNGAATESALAYDAVHHLKSTVFAKPLTAFPTPPGPALSPSGMYSQINSSFPAKLIPAGLTHPQVSSNSFPSPQPPGLEENHYIDVNFSGSGSKYTSGYVNIEVFDSTKDAQSHYNNPTFLNAADSQITQTYDVLSPSSFSASQQLRCSTYALSAGGGEGPVGVSSCYVQWGDVVIVAATQRNATMSDPHPATADNNMAITLAIAGVLFVGQELNS